MEPFNTIEGSATGEYEEKKSRFIAALQHVETEAEALAFLDKIRAENPMARHNVYAYILRENNRVRYSDDGEPQKTAGIPTLSVLEHAGLKDVACVVTRYFGGTLLGAGGLVRAYSHTASLALEQAGIITYEPYAEYALVCGYSEYGKYSTILADSGAVIDGTDFAEAVTLRYALPIQKGEAVAKKIIEAGYGKDIPTVTGERFDYR
jgi:uncharacterized YigZ family protein